VSRGRKLVLGVVVALLLAAIGVVLYLGPIAPIATGYAAKVACSAVFVVRARPRRRAGRPAPEPAGAVPAHARGPVGGHRAGDAPRVLRFDGVLHPATRLHVGRRRPAFTGPSPLPPPDPGQPWPQGDAPAELPAEVDGAALDAAIATAFTEDDPEGRLRNTRAVVVVKDGAADRRALRRRVRRADAAARVVDGQEHRERHGGSADRDGDAGARGRGPAPRSGRATNGPRSRSSTC
jgi:hypothetical protein